jgi:hypothetical protein
MTETISHTRPPAKAVTAAPPVSDLARVVTCTLCWSPPLARCQRDPAGNHLRRYQDAARRGVLSSQALADVVSGLKVIAAHVIVPDVTP